jgi:hypothetical protein
VGENHVAVFVQLNMGVIQTYIRQKKIINSLLPREDHCYPWGPFRWHLYLLLPLAFSPTAFSKIIERLAMVVHAYNPSTREVDAGSS